MLVKNMKDGARFVTKLIKLPPATLASPESAGCSPSCSTFDPAPCYCASESIREWPKHLATKHQMKVLDPGFNLA